MRAKAKAKNATREAPPLGRMALPGKGDGGARAVRGRARAGAAFPAAPSRLGLPRGYADALAELKERIRQERLRVVLAASSAMVLLYWDIGRMILGRQESAGWGARVIDRLSADLREAFPDMKGLSPRNLKYMRAFAAAWPDAQIVQRVVARLPWRQNIALLERLGDPETRLWYARRAAEQGWSQSLLCLHIEGQDHRRQAKALSNFESTLPPADSDLARQVFKDPYLFDFLGTAEPRREAEVEQALVDQIQRFLLELGSGFAFVGRQVPLEIGGQDYFVDLLFHHLRLRRYAPYLNYRPLAEGEPGVEALLARPECSWISRELEQKALSHAIASVVPEHLAEVRGRKVELIAKTEAADKDRLTKESNYWDHRAEPIKAQEQAGKPNARLNSGEARKRADLLEGRLEKRLEELRLEAQIAPLPPVVLGGVLVVPKGLLASMRGEAPAATSHVVDTQASAARAREVVMEVERSLGFVPTDRELEKLGNDIESRVPRTGKLRFIEVKGRVSGAQKINVTRNEILHSLNKPDDFILALVKSFEDGSQRVHYVRRPFEKEPDFHVTDVDYEFAELIALGTSPS